MTNDDEQDPAMPPPEVIEAFAKHCRCPRCCGDVPCAGVMAGGMCDEASCRCGTDSSADDEDDEDDEDDHFHHVGDDDWWRHG